MICNVSLNKSLDRGVFSTVFQLFATTLRYTEGAGVASDKSIGVSSSPLIELGDLK